MPFCRIGESEQELLRRIVDLLVSNTREFTYESYNKIGNAQGYLRLGFRKNNLGIVIRFDVSINGPEINFVIEEIYFVHEKDAIATSVYHFLTDKQNTIICDAFAELVSKYTFLWAVPSHTKIVLDELSKENNIVRRGVYR